MNPNIIRNLTNSDNKTKKVLINCIKENIKTQFYKESELDRLNSFLKWLKENNFKINIKKHISREYVKNNNLYDLKEKINSVLEDIMGDKYIKYRIKYSVIKVLEFMKKYGTQIDSNTYKKILSYFDSLNPNKSLDDVFNDLDIIFENIFGNSFEYYETIYEKYINKLTEIKFNKWKIPKFKIIDSYGIMENIDLASSNIKFQNKDMYDLGTTLENTNDNEMLNKIQLYVKNSMDTSLRDDLIIINSILNEDKSFIYLWFKVYNYLKSNSKKPLKVVRNGLILMLIFLVKDIDIDILISKFLELDIDIDPYMIKNKNSIIYKLLWDIMDNIGQLSKYKEKLKLYINPPLDYSKLYNFINNQKNIDNDFFIKNINNIIKQGNSERLQKENIYNFLKPYKNIFNPKITREFIYSIL